ncbi:MAG TPA: transferrin-binding protein-like solute binding protein [Stellaceae bacterium]|jgi:hypothetical protein
MTLRLKTTVAVLALFPLAACGGGGGGGGGISGGAPVTGSSATTTSSSTSSSTDSSSGSTTPVAMTTSTTGAVMSTTTTGTLGASPALLGSADTNTVTISTAADGTPQTIGFDIHGSGGDYTHTFDVSKADPNAVAGFLSVNESTNALGGVEHQLIFQNLSYSTFGVWQLNNDDGSGVSGAFSQGKDTPVANLPTTGTATYNGSTVAQVNTVGAGGTGTTGTVTGAAALTADFGKGTVVGNFTNFAGAGGKTLNDLTMNANIAAGTNTFAGGVQSTDGALTGNGAGAFHGPQYNEVAGTYHVSGGNTSAVGAFGAKR